MGQSPVPPLWFIKNKTQKQTLLSAAAWPRALAFVQLLPRFQGPLGGLSPLPSVHTECTLEIS